MSLLVLGHSGQLARHIHEREPSAVLWGRKELDLADGTAVESRILAFSPRAILNAAAYTAVDRAQSDRVAAWQVNADGPAGMARAAARLGVPLVHVSTDYVFDGTSTRPYRVDDPVRPLNVYGRSKLAGELAVSTLHEQTWILRASWVFSEFEGNFVRTILRLASQREELRVVADQYGRPTYAGDLAAAVLGVAKAALRAEPPLPGTYHVAGGPVVSWHQFAERIVRAAEVSGLVSRIPRILPIATSEYPTPAARPLRAVLAPSDELRAVMAFEPSWERGLSEVMTRLQEVSH